MLEVMRTEILDVLKYKYDNFYVGSMAVSKVCTILEISYGNDDLVETIKKACKHEISEVHEYLEHYIDVMKESPIKKCPHCGQMMLA